MSLPDAWPDGRILDRFTAVERDVAELADVQAILAGLRADVRNLEVTVARQNTELSRMADAIKARDDLMTQERGENKRALIALLGVLLAAVIAAVATAAASGVFG